MSPVFYLSDGYLANGAEPWAIPSIDSLPKIVVVLTDPATFMPYSRDEETLARPFTYRVRQVEQRIGGIEKQHITGNVNYDPKPPPHGQTASGEN
jgi:2-oxoglutarate ferredoxin oxidoreductase subunit alpha